MNKVEITECEINEKMDAFLEELKNEENGFIAIKKIAKFSSIISNEYSDKNDIFNKILKWYIEKVVSKANQENTLEKIFQHDLVIAWMNLENLKYLLAQNIDLQYEFDDQYVGGSETIVQKLAFKTKDKDKMKLVLEKIGDKLYYFNTLDQSIDLCRMNIIAGNLDKAFEIFRSSEYEILLGQSKEISRVINVQKDKGIHIDGFNPRYDDVVFSIIETLKSVNASKEEKEDFLKKIIYSNKIKGFSIESMEIINTFVSDDVYNCVSDYLYYKALNEELTLFRSENTESSIFNHSIMFFVTPKEFKEITKGVSLKK